MNFQKEMLPLNISEYLTLSIITVVKQNQRVMEKRYKRFSNLITLITDEDLEIYFETLRNIELISIFLCFCIKTLPFADYGGLP